MRQLALVAVVRDRAPRLVEWLAFHRAVGVRDFVIYDDGSRDDTAAILKAHAQLGVVTVPWPEARGTAHELTPQDHFLVSRVRLFRFAVFLDLDEFLVPPPGRGIDGWLAEVPAHAGAVRFAPQRFNGAGAAPGLVLRGLPSPAVGSSEPEPPRPVRALYRRGAVTMFRDAVEPDIVQGEWLNGDFSSTRTDPREPVRAPAERGAIQLNRYVAKASSAGTNPCVRTQAWIGPTLDEMRHVLAYASTLPGGEGAPFAALRAAVPELAEPVGPVAHRRWRWHNLQRRWLEGAGRSLRRLVRPRPPRPW